eukprot:TRINITY_DN4666_c0_g2_i1.p3 TRINITY_DN4666_c0_g2~~TRINITY_DN4666_c0_g2_i1.p3  ORF type:complete len:130 (+),score=44.28 TRINITY_DN4666_c0_g2_i1:59-391(+)
MYDSLFVPIGILVIGICKMVEQLYIGIGLFFKVWVVDKSLPHEAEIDIDFGIPDETPAERSMRKEIEFKKEYAKIDSPRVMTNFFRHEFVRRNALFLNENLPQIMTWPLV